MEKLFIDHKTAFDWSVINGNLSSLIQLNLEFDRSKMNDGVESQIINFLKENQQIEQLALTRSTVKLVEKANEHLPKLKFLKLEQFSTDALSQQGDPIHMKNLVHFSLRSYHADEIPERLVFDQLDRLDMNIFPYTFTDAWAQFIAKHVDKDVNEFTLDAAVLTADQFVAISNKFRNLKNAGFSCAVKLTAEEIVEFTEKCESLAKLELNIQMDDWERSRLDEILSIEWKIEEKTRRNDDIEMTLKR